MKAMNKDEMNARLTEAAQKKPVLILAHRGSVGANIVDNTLESYDAAILHGADAVEVDICMSKDGDLFAFHDGTELMMLGTKRSILKLSTAEVKSLRYLNKNFMRIDHPINTFDEVMEHLKGQVLINLDRCWDCWDQVFEKLSRHNMADQIIFKSPPEHKYIDKMAAQKQPYMYMPIIWHRDELNYVLNSPVNMVAVEFIGYREDAGIMQPEFVHSLREKGIHCLISALTLGNPVLNQDAFMEKCRKSGSRMADALVNGNIYLAGGHDDDTSVLGAPDLGWGWLVNRGFNILQTDWTLHLADYLKKSKYGTIPFKAETGTF